MEKLTQRWREKVYECLVANKRYEVINKENVRTFQTERGELIGQLNKAKQEL